MAYTNLADPTSSDWVNDSRLSSSGTDKGEGGYAGGVVTNWIDCKRGDVIRVKGIDFVSDNNAPYMVVEWEDTSISNDVCDLNSYTSGFVVENDITTFNILCMQNTTDQFQTDKGEVTKIRLSGMLTADSAKNVIITKNEEIV